MADQPHPRLQQLARKWREGTLTEAERQEFDAWFHAEEQGPQEVDPEFGRTPEEQSARLFARIESQIKNRPHTRKLWPRIAAAASILLMLSAGGYFVLHKQKEQHSVAQNQQQDITPGHNQATLTLANGQKIVLTKGLSGTLAQQGLTQVQVNSGNAIAYTASGSEAAEVLYNTLTTKKGEQSPYPLILADGTKVWLNAQSSITFPTAFTGKERIVKITGEAYLEVAHNENQPFKVSVKGQTIEDIGTAFNIKAYDDEPHIKTTLIEGKIKVNGLILKPGQETDGQSISAGNTETAIAWQKGLFQFKHATLASVMREAARWYDVDISYENNIPPITFSGGIPRNVNASKLLDILKYTGVHFSIEGQKIIVKP